LLAGDKNYDCLQKLLRQTVSNNLNNSALNWRFALEGASFFASLGMYCFTRVHPPEVLMPVQATYNALAGHTGLFGSAPSVFYTLAIGLLIGACASTPARAKLHCLAWMGLTLILEGSRHSIFANPIFRYLSENVTGPGWNLVEPDWTTGTFDHLNIIASVVGGLLALTLLTHLSPEHKHESRT
jgi:hypothetical protein